MGTFFWHLTSWSPNFDTFLKDNVVTNVTNCKWRESELIIAADLHEQTFQRHFSIVRWAFVSIDLDLRKHQRREGESCVVSEWIKAAALKQHRERETAEREICVFVFDDLLVCHVISQHVWSNSSSSDRTDPCLPSFIFHARRSSFKLKSDEDVFIREPSRQHESAAWRGSLSPSGSDDAPWLRATKHRFVTRGGSRPQTAGQVVVLGLWDNSVWQPVFSTKGHGRNQRQWCNWNWETAQRKSQWACLIQDLSHF